MQYLAGKDTSYCLGMFPNYALGSTGNSTATATSFSWSPATGLNNPTSPNPIANPSVTTTYSLTVTGGGCTMQTGTVTINLLTFNLNLAFNDTTINEGQTITLISNSSATSYTWMPNNNIIKYQ